MEQPPAPVSIAPVNPEPLTPTARKSVTVPDVVEAVKRSTEQLELARSYAAKTGSKANQEVLGYAYGKAAVDAFGGILLSLNRMRLDAAR